MKNIRHKFSLRALLALVAIVAIFCLACIRFGSHATWLATSVQRPVIQSVPVSPLLPAEAKERTQLLNLGPYELQLPISMCTKVSVQRPGNGGTNLVFSDKKRTAIINISPMQNFVMFPLPEFSEKAYRTDQSVYREIVNSGSDDFSFGMTREQLRWHKWLVNNRQHTARIESLEYVDKANLEANLLKLSSNAYNFEWGTIDGEWKGAVTFIDQTGESSWIRHAASSFELSGDPTAISGKTDAQLKTFVTFLNPNVKSE